MVAHLAVTHKINNGDKLSRLPQKTFDRILAGMYKLAMEKLEPVRAAAAFALGTMQSAGVDAVWDWEGAGRLVVDLPDGSVLFKSYQRSC